MPKWTILTMTYSRHAETDDFDHVIYNCHAETDNFDHDTSSNAETDHLTMKHSSHAETDDFDHDTFQSC
jgi:hypothetical protein